MNKKFLYYILAVSLVASCRKDDDKVFDKSPDERLNETLTAYQTALTGSQYGWNANLTTGDGGTYRFYFSFNANNRVEMYSDFDSTTATQIKESSYRLKALQQPALIFDTYSYIHLLSDPDGAVNGGQYGAGLRSDFEFSLDTLAGDSVRLTGRFNGSKLTLRKAAQGDRNIWATKQVTNGVVNFRNYWKFLQYWRRLTYSGTQYELQFDSARKNVTVSWTSGSQTQSVNRGYYFWANGVYFSDPVVNGSTAIPGFTITNFNAGTQTMSVTVNGTAAAITGFNAPLNPDVKSGNAANRWWQRGVASDDYYWVSFDGFHVNGVDDAYNIKSLKNDSAKFYFFLYKPNTNAIDAFFTIYRDTLDNSLDVEHGSFVQMNINSTGRARFSEYQNRFPWPATGAAANSHNQLLEGGGYFFVQSSPYTYDMVSVTDAKIWMTWYWVF